MRYNGVIFDFNGTLLFDDPYHDIAWGKVAREVCGQDVDGHELVSKYSGYPNIEILRDISGGTLTDEQLEYYSLRKEALYREIVRSVPGGASLAPGAVELFDYIKEKYKQELLEEAKVKDSTVYIGNILLGENFDDIDIELYRILKADGAVNVIYNQKDKYVADTISYLMENNGVVLSSGSSKLVVVPKRKISTKTRLLHNKLAYLLGISLFKKGSKMRAILKSKL
jgi:hypothetical protein